jgi:hypothetical protein
LLLGRLEGPLRLSLLRGIEKSGIDNREVPSLGSFPFFRGVRSRDSAPCVRILDHFDSVPNHLASIEFVQENAMMALLVSVDGRRERGSDAMTGWRLRESLAAPVAEISP